MKLTTETLGKREVTEVFKIFLLRVLPDLRASAVILFKWAAKSGDFYRRCQETT